ncbi:aldose epimerase family protein [Sphingomonas azotifigens]|uniref:aldose epimerase family protein n=1 Tax=Sphingomonas azotifigens TaxID=330920 RepID=UPI0009FECEB2|nr:aldose epimerase family protein [Sphingomonas azotifigens]
MSRIEVVEIARGAFRAQFLTLGATLHRLEVPDRLGRSDNVVLGYADLEDYRRQPPRYYGAVAGRYANRIAGGRFTLDGETFQLTTNEGRNSLHSGPGGFDQQLWTVEARRDDAVTFRLDSPHGWNGFPGDLVARVEYALEADGLAVRFTATPDRATIVNLTQHAYFNLAGESSGVTVLDHLLQIPASAITPVNDALIPTGELAPVDGGAFDFRTPKLIGLDIDAADPQLALGQGYDHNFVLDGPAGFERRIATLFDPVSGRVLEVHSTEPGVQFYSGNYLADGAPGTGGGVYPKRGGLCLEPQKFPDSPNQPDFPSARAEAGETYRHSMAFRFRTAAGADEAFPL